MKDRMVRFLQRVRGASHVIRWNFHPHIKSETVAEHSFHAAVFALVLLERAEVPPAVRDVVLGAALLHDAEEAITGDLPALAKRSCPGWLEQVEHRGESELLEDAERLRRYRLSLPIIKLADRFASLMYADQEVLMGNGQFTRIRAELIAELYGLVDKLPAEYHTEDAKALLTPEQKVNVWRVALDLLEGLGFNKEDGQPQVGTMSHL